MYINDIVEKIKNTEYNKTVCVIFKSPITGQLIYKSAKFSTIQEAELYVCAMKNLYIDSGIEMTHIIF